MKYVVVLGDGMADYPVEELGGKTPLDVANHPNMDYIANMGEFGLVRTVPEGMKPGSDTANLSVFGYDPKVYYSGRSPLEAASLGVELGPKDVTYRCNFVTLTGGGPLETTTLADYSAGEISSEEAAELVAFLNENLATEDVRLYPGFSYRHCLVMRNAADGAELIPPHDFTGKPVEGRLPQGQNTDILFKWMTTAYACLKDHPVNKARVARGENPANGIWFWGEGRKPALMPFQEKTGLTGAVVSAVDLVQGIGKCAGMDILHVEGATGTYKTNFSGKTQAALDALRDGCDYVYIHMEAPDECGHQHQVQEKVYSIEQIDEKVLGPILHGLGETGEKFTVLLLPDHPTPLSLRTHVSDPVPYVLYRCGDNAGRNLRYCEQDAKETGVFVEEGYTLIDRMLGLGEKK